MNWFTSDNHFGHSAVIQYCNRPFTNLAEMNEELIKRWNNRIKPDDTVYVVGDLALCPFKEFEPIAARLNGKKFLIKGNHDHYSNAQYERLGFKVFRELLMDIAGRRVRLSHFPYAPRWWKRPFCYKSELRFLERRPKRVKGETLMHGHSHVRYKKSNDGRIHVGVDAWNFYPVSQREIESLLNLRR